MDLICLGLNHQTAPVEVRERYAVPSSRLGISSHELAQLAGLEEVVVLSTCNRMEVYLIAEDEQHAVAMVKDYLAQGHAGGTDDDAHFYQKCGEDAAIHLCRVASGLDSMVLGETEIFGQVKQAYQAALHENATGSRLNKLFQKSFGIGKKVRTQTSIQEGLTSVGSVAIDLAEKIFGHLRDSEVMVIGAGEMSRVTAFRLKERGVKKIHVVNRSLVNALELANELGGEAHGFDDWEQVLVKVDVVVSSTGASEPVVRPHHIEAVRSRRKYRPIFMIDIAMPRDIDPDVGRIDEVYLYDLDTLQLQADENRERRAEQVRVCESIIQKEIRQLNLELL